jgi:hypothetical protein
MGVKWTCLLAVTEIRASTLQRGTVIRMAATKIEYRVAFIIVPHLLMPMGIALVSWALRLFETPIIENESTNAGT